MRPVIAVENFQIEDAAVAYKALNHLALVADTEYHTANSLASYKPQLVRDERFTSQFQHGFREIFGQRQHPGGQAARKNCEGGHLAHCTIVLVPSKSNRKRTSVKPTWFIVWRRRVLSSA